MKYLFVALFSYSSLSIDRLSIMAASSPFSQVQIEAHTSGCRCTEQVEEAEYKIHWRLLNDFRKTHDDPVHGRGDDWDISRESLVSAHTVRSLVMDLLRSIRMRPSASP